MAQTMWPNKPLATVLVDKSNNFSLVSIEFMKYNSILLSYWKTYYAGKKNMSFLGNDIYKSTYIKEVLSTLQIFYLREKKIFESSKNVPVYFR